MLVVSMIEQIEQLKGELDFEKILFLHINRVLQAIYEPDIYMSAVEAFEDVLFPYIDKNYEKSLQDKEMSILDIEKLDTQNRSREGLINNAKIQLSRQKFRQLMMLAKKKGLLLSERGKERI